MGRLTTKLTCRYGAQRNSGQVQRLVRWRFAFYHVGYYRVYFNCPVLHT
jgi:hypothetical protein